MHCIIAFSDNKAPMLIQGLKALKDYGFDQWVFEPCSTTDELLNMRDKRPDVVLVDRLLPGEKHSDLLKNLQLMFPVSRIVLYLGKMDEEAGAYERMAKNFGLNNIVKGELPGERPYNLFTALLADIDEVLNGTPRTDKSLSERQEENHQECPPSNNLIDSRDDNTVDEDIITSQNMVKRTKKYKVVRKKTFERIPSKAQEKQQVFGAKGNHCPVRENQGALIATVANKGGVGKTTTAITVAMALADAGIDVVLVDLNLPGPSVHNFFDLKPDSGIEALAGYNIALLGHVLVKAHGRENLTILPGPMDETILPDTMFKQGELAKLINALLSMSTVVIVDTPSNFWDKPWLPEVFQMVDMVLAVVDQSKFSQGDTSKHSRKILKMKVTPDKIKIVLNKFSPKLHNARIVEKAFNERLIGYVPKKMLPKVIATIPNEWDKYNLLGYKGEAAGLDDHMSQWHRLAEEIANLAGFKYNKPVQKSKKRKGNLLGLFKRG